MKMTPPKAASRGERARDQREPDQRLEEGNARLDEPREVVPHPDRDAAERQSDMPCMYIAP